MPRRNRRRADGAAAGYPTCGACRQQITFVRMNDTGKSMPIDPYPVNDGNICARPSGAVLAGWVISKDRPAVRGSGYRRYAAHFATCPNRPRGRQAKPVQPVVLPPPTLF